MSTDAPTNEPTTLVLVSVEDKETGEIEMDFTGGGTHAEQVIGLHTLMVDADTTEKRSVLLIIPRSVGPELLVNLLTEDQWDAVTSA